MKNWKYIMLAMTLPFMGACSSDDVETETEENNLIRLEAIHPSQTRATDTNFERNDEIGVYMTAQNTPLQLGGNELNNQKFMFNGSVWTSENKVYWNKGQHNIYAYYPYTNEVNGIENFKFTVEADQTLENIGNGMSGYEASDFLWTNKIAIAASATPVKLQFSHCMSKVDINIQKGEGFEGEIPSDVEVFIHNTVRVASVDLENGGVSKDDFAGASTVKARKVSNTQYTACLVPQNIQTRRPLVEIITQGVSYLLEGKISLRQGVKHTITVTLTKNPDQTKVEIGGGIENW